MPQLSARLRERGSHVRRLHDGGRHRRRRPRGRLQGFESRRPAQAARRADVDEPSFLAEVRAPARAPRAKPSLPHRARADKRACSLARACARDSQLSALDSATASVLMQDLTHELPSTETDDASAPSVRPQATAPSKPAARRTAGPRRADRTTDATRVGSRRSFERSAGSTRRRRATRRACRRGVGRGRVNPGWNGC